MAAFRMAAPKTPTQDKFKELLALVHADLKPLGFKKRGQNFYLGRGDNVGVINVQKSVWGSRSDIRFTINVSAWSRRLEAAFTPFVGTLDLPTEAACQWRQRIGHWHRGNRGEDRWWDVHSSTNIRQLYAEISPTLLEECVPAIRSRLTDAGFRDALLKNCLAGEPVSFRHLKFLIEQLGPSEMMAVVESAEQKYERELPARRAAVLEDVRRFVSQMSPGEVDSVLPRADSEADA